ncbi:uncharacterized protein LOC142229719 [Haematobia irritans]|uniref:uncharacterized protein LOC142229719 n=1 Tax=Haematobia irritans TaxID=7368 RepID=UPI003F50B791
MCVVIDLDVVCLICLHHSEEMHSIFSNDGDGDSDGIQIAQKITTLSKLKVEADDENLPDKICDDCFKDLTAAWRFHKNCQTAMAVFKSILNPFVKSMRGSQNEDTKRRHAEDQAESEEKANVSVIELDGGSVHTEDTEEILEEHRDLEVIASEGESIIQTGKIGEDDTEDCNSTTETAEDDLEMVEFYVSDDGGLHELTQGEYLQNKATSSITQKKLDMNTSQSSLRKKPEPESSATEPTKANVESIKLSKTPKTFAKTNTRSQEKIKNQSISKLNVKDQYTEEEHNHHQKIEKPIVQSARKRKTPAAGNVKPRPPKICEICGNSYRFQHALNAHMRRHYQDKPFPCEMCEKAFVSNVELRRHMRVHTGLKPYACQYCDRRFSDFGSRIKHERTHTGERPYACTTCGKSFAYPHVLSVHLRTHTGEKKFRCEYCSKGFTKKAYLLSHIEQHHSFAKEGVTYETTLDNDEGGDAILEDNNDMHEMKDVKFDDCVFTSEYGGETHEIIQEECDDDEISHDDGSDKKIVVQQSLLRPKIESGNRSDSDVQEVEIHLDEYTLRVR